MLSWLARTQFTIMRYSEMACERYYLPFHYRACGMTQPNYAVLVSFDQTLSSTPMSSFLVSVSVTAS